MKNGFILLAQKYAMNLIFIITAFGTAASIYFSEFMELSPCDLCWYQRVFFYPILVISLISLIKKDENAYRYTLVLSVIGLPISIYHHLLKVTDLFPKDTIFCDTYGACSELEWELWAGSDITIPLLATFGFLGVAFFSILLYFRDGK